MTDQKVKILLVEDDQSLGYLMTDFLTSKGLEMPPVQKEFQMASI